MTSRTASEATAVEAEKALDADELKGMLTDQRIVLAAMFAGLVVATGRSLRLTETVSDKLVVSSAETKGRISKAEQKQICRLSGQQKEDYLNQSFSGF